MLASQLVEEMGEALVGRIVDTEEIGDWPGGLATVIEIAPDPGAPEIVFNVESPEAGKIGVFEHEWVELVAV